MAPKPAALLATALPQTGPRRPGRKRAGFRSILFPVGDCLFLLVVGAVAAACMRLVDALEWNPVLTWVVGMALAMSAQTLLAFAAAPLLGSIETMVPSMVVAMICPMVLDILEMGGADVGWSWSIRCGAGLGLAMFLFVEGYDVLCRRSVHRVGVRR